MFESSAISDKNLQKQVFQYAQELAGGKVLVPTGTEGAWVAKLDNGTKINVRSISTSNASRWTVDVVGNQDLKALTFNGKSNKTEVKFK